MVEPKEKKPAAERSYEWLIHINENFKTTVKSPNVEGALMQAFALYWQEHSTSSIFVFNIEVLNLTLYSKAQAKEQ